MSPYLSPIARPYDLRVLLDVYVLTKRTDFVHPDFPNYYAGLLAALESLFGVRIAADGFSTRQKALWSLFNNTVRSLLQTSTPWDTYLEEGLIVTSLKASGDAGRLVFDASDAITRAADASRAGHRDMLYGLFVAMFGACDRIVTSEDLRLAGFDDATEPDLSNYWEYM